MGSLLALCVALFCSSGAAEEASSPTSIRNRTMLTQQQHPLTAPQKQTVAIAASAATGDIPALNAALHQGLDAGLTISDCREILVQLYAYAGFPRSLNALAELMKVVEARREQGKNDAEGNTPGPLSKPEEMLAVGTQNQTTLAGGPVKGALFDFAPAIDSYLKVHLFGDIFSRDNLDWKRRELATVGALAAMTGVESQLKAHLNISRNVGLTDAQLAELVPLFESRGEQNTAQRLQRALESGSAQ
ncbi:MAG TPA: carboxymuconolactone decarboxylase [Pantoea sp.]|nr:carboxymuconolactone decarboxylase [Pantoea sp. FDAARGOS_194]HAK35787.1 carboxymuconolactone decarboxylase [Pantoea sp.]